MSLECYRIETHGEVAVSGDEEEVVIHELLADGLLHAGEGVVLAGQVPGQVGQRLGEHRLDVDPLLLGDAGGQPVAVHVAAHADAGGVDGHAGLDVAHDLVGVHVGGVLGVGGDAVVLLDDGIEDLREVLVGVPVSGVDAAVLVVELDGAGGGLGEGEAAGLGLDVLDLVPPLLGDVLGHQGVGGLDDGELSRHVVAKYCCCCCQLLCCWQSESPVRCGRYLTPWAGRGRAGRHRRMWGQETARRLEGCRSRGQYYQEFLDVDGMGLEFR